MVAFAHPLSVPRSRGLPAELTSFVGRAAEVAHLTHLLGQTRLLTLTGAGGSGKSRLALRVAAASARAHPDGVAFLDLAAVEDPALLPTMVARQLGLHEWPETDPATARERLAAALADRRALLILDNCEHLLESSAQLAEALLRAGPRLVVLATSREALRAEGETVWPMAPLAVPPSDCALDPQELAGVEAVALFCDRARARQPEFALTEANVAAVAEICRRLEGLPLAIELAAALLPALAPEAIAARLDDALTVLTRGSRTTARHATLRTALNWSYRLLPEPERMLLRRLAVFPASFDLDAAEAVAGDLSSDGPRGLQLTRSAVGPTLARLVDASVVTVVPAPARTRYRLLEPVRQYAWAQLSAAGEAEDLRARHAEYYLQLAELAEPSLKGRERWPWLWQLEQEDANFQRALAWSLTTPAVAERVAVGERLAAALMWYWNILGRPTEAYRWLTGSLAMSEGVPAPVRARALWAAGEFAWLLGKYAEARAHLEASAVLWRALDEPRGLAYVLQVLASVVEEPAPCFSEALTLFRDLDDPWGMALAVFTAGMVASERGDEAEAETQLSEGLARFRALGDEWFCTQVLNALGDAARRRGQVATAAAYYEESLAILKRLGVRSTVPSLLHNLGWLAIHQGDPRRAWRLFRESLSTFRMQGDLRGVAECLVGLSGSLGALRQAERAARLLGAAERLLQTTQAVQWWANRADYEATEAQLQAQLGDRFAAARADGSAAPLDRLLADLFGGDAAAEMKDLATGHADHLTARELDVVALLGEGLSNRQIADRLVITEGTARLYVHRILSKLGLSSRAQVAAWAARRHPTSSAASLHLVPQ